MSELHDVDGGCQVLGCLSPISGERLEGLPLEQRVGLASVEWFAVGSGVE